MKELKAARATSIGTIELSLSVMIGTLFDISET